MLFRIALFVSAALWAQDSGVLTGTVTDSSGAVVVGAQVVATNLATNFESTAESNSEGLYRIPFLRPATYRVRITAPGFKTFVRENVELRVGATLPIHGVMEVGAVADSVEVTSAVPLLETETSTTGTVITGDFFQRMPLYQRHSRALLYLTPGVNVSGLGYAGSMGGFSINGGATSNIGYFEDGMYGVQPSGTNTTDTILSTIEEAKVITTVLPAEYGHSAGGAIVIVKKSGTNQLHGGGGILFREGPMQHRRFMQPARFEQTGNSLHFYQPDFNVSGPVLIPKLYDGRNKTFFMFAGQYLMERQGEQISWSVPTPEELSGNFAFGGRPGVNAIYDPRPPLSTAQRGRARRFRATLFRGRNGIRWRRSFSVKKFGNRRIFRALQRRPASPAISNCHARRPSIGRITVSAWTSSFQPSSRCSLIGASTLVPRSRQISTS